MGQENPRKATLTRRTNESMVEATITIDGTGKSRIMTTVPFFDHMLEALSKHSLIDMDITAEGDTHVDAHHTIEDTAIVLGKVLKAALGQKRGIRRFGQARVPLDEALAEAAVDLSGRSYLMHTGEPEGQNFYQVGGHFTGSMTRHVFEAIASNAALCLHMDLIRGRDPHHIIEAQFKAFARALRQAAEMDPRVEDVPSTKGII